MPLMNELLAGLEDDTPSTKQELYDLLDKTGYSLILKEPGMHRDKMRMERSEERQDGSVREEEDLEYDEDNGSIEVMAIPEEALSILPPGMTPPCKQNPRMKMRSLTLIAAHKHGKPEEGKHE
jgi:hypothetical protein